MLAGIPSWRSHAARAPYRSALAILDPRERAVDIALLNRARFLGERNKAASPRVVRPECPVAGHDVVSLGLLGDGHFRFSRFSLVSDRRLAFRDTELSRIRYIGVSDTRTASNCEFPVRIP